MTLFKSSVSARINTTSHMSATGSAPLIWQNPGDITYFPKAFVFPELFEQHFIIHQELHSPGPWMAWWPKISWMLSITLLVCCGISLVTLKYGHNMTPLSIIAIICLLERPRIQNSQDNGKPLPTLWTNAFYFILWCSDTAIKGEHAFYRPESRFCS